MRQLGPLGDLIPNKNIDEFYNAALNNVLQARLVYIKATALGISDDTSNIGLNSYSEVINSIISLRDTVLKSLEPERTKLLSSIAEGKENLENFAKAMNDREEELRKE
ncbi:MAG TPA: hypothetical protein VEB40_13150 [Flavipsychrobacter sp.]|nr:hypothetical protein [Flavipsychrobacter sp.]